MTTHLLTGLIFIYDSLDNPAIDTIISRQKLAIKLGMSNPWLAMCADDCFDVPKQFTTTTWNRIFKHCRHWKMMVLIVMSGH